MGFGKSRCAPGMHQRSGWDLQDSPGIDAWISPGILLGSALGSSLGSALDSALGSVWIHLSISFGIPLGGLILGIIQTHHKIPNLSHSRISNGYSPWIASPDPMGTVKTGMSWTQIPDVIPAVPEPEGLQGIVIHTSPSQIPNIP